MNVKFFDSRGIVHALVTDSNKRVRISMGIKTEPYRFTGRFIGRGDKIDYLNHELEKRRSLLGDICMHHGIDNVRAVYTPEPTKWEPGTDIAKMTHSYVDGMRSGEIRTKGGKNFAVDSVRTFAQSADYLSKFMADNEKKSGTRYDIKQFNTELKEKAAIGWLSMFRKFENWMLDKGLSVRSRQNTINQVSIMIRHFADAMFIGVPKVPQVLQAENEVIALPPSFIGEFLNSPMPDAPELRMVWEVAATILVTSLRISDVMSLSAQDFNPDFTSIRKVLSKTGTCSMPIPARLTSIYRSNMLHGRVFSIPPSRKSVYQHLRELMSKYETLRAPLTLFSMDIHGKKVPETMPYWMWVTPHVLRKTAITSMLYHGVSHLHVRHASGHSQTSKAFWQYVKVVDDLYERDISDAHQKMGISMLPERINGDLL